MSAIWSCSAAIRARFVSAIAPTGARVGLGAPSFRTMNGCRVRRYDGHWGRQAHHLANGDAHLDLSVPHPAALAGQHLHLGTDRPGAPVATSIASTFRRTAVYTARTPLHHGAAATRPRTTSTNLILTTAEAAASFSRRGHNSRKTDNSAPTPNHIHSTRPAAKTISPTTIADTPPGLYTGRTDYSIRATAGCCGVRNDSTIPPCPPGRRGGPLR